MNDWFDERYIKETPIEEQIRGQVRAECHYMDKADIYEWITQNQIKIMNLQSKIDKVVELNNKIINSTEEKVKINCDDNYYLIFDAGYTRILSGLINDILEENK